MKRTAAALVIVLGAGCKGNGPSGAPPPSSVAPAVPVTATSAARLPLPRVVDAAALAPANTMMASAVAFLDARGRVRLTVSPPTWSAGLDASAAGFEVDPTWLELLAAQLDGGAEFDPADGASYPVADPTFEVARVPLVVDDEDEPGGTGTAMALEELRARQPPKPAPVELTDVQRRAAGWYGDVAAFPAPIAGDPAAHRLTWVTGWIGDGPDLAPVQPRVAVAALPGSSGRALVNVLTAARGTIAVDHGGAVRVLRLDFARRDRGYRVPVEARDAPWLEVRVAVDGLAVEAVAEPPVAIAWPIGAPLDRAALAKAWADTRTRRGLADRTDVDVLVAGGVDAQRLVDVLVALDGAGARSISLGHAPDPASDDARARGRTVATARVGAPVATGDLDTAELRRAIAAGIAARIGPITVCYELELARDPRLAGTLETQFFITPDGSVATASASGVHPAIATCVADIIKHLTFPKPRGGGGVQVNLPFKLGAR